MAESSFQRQMRLDRERLVASETSKPAPASEGFESDVVTSDAEEMKGLSVHSTFLAEPDNDDGHAVTDSEVSALVFTRVTNTKGALTKTFSVNKDDPNGKPIKNTDANVYEGTAQKIVCADLYEFRDQLLKARSNEAFTYGVTEHSSVNIVTKDKVAKTPGAVARGREHFHYRSAPGIWMLDYDAGYLTVEYETAESLRDALTGACANLADAPMLWTPSASTYIHNSATDVMVKGAGGSRIYIPVDNASDVVRAQAALREYLWANGIGTYTVSKSGQLIERTLIDLKTAQPERLDFVAGAKCVAPLEQRRPAPIIFESELVGGVGPVPLQYVLPDPDRSVRQKAEEARAAAKAMIEPERQRVREAYKGERVAALCKNGVPELRAQEIVAQALDRDYLFAEFELHAADGTVVTVAQVLDNSKRWHGARFADPLEPDYCNDTRIAFANLRSGGRPYIYSHAHGGKRYTLFRQPAILSVNGGDAPRLADACLDLLRCQQEVFDGPVDGMVRVANEGRMYQVNLPWLQDHLGTSASFQRFDRRSKSYHPIDVPPVVTNSILAREGQRNLPVLNAVVTAPVLRVDGSVLDVPGYDVSSGILYVSNTLDVPRVNPSPKFDDVMAALKMLWEPVAQFPYDGPASRAVALATLLTSCVRRSLPTAPATIFDAPSAGTGKTLLAKCVAVLGGHNTDTVKWPGANVEETTKLVMASFRDGKTCLTFDNVVGKFGNEALDIILTSAEVSGRVLGLSEMHTVVNRCLVMATGNNITTQGDTNRRVLRCRIDARIERPYHRSFPFNPAQMIEANRLHLVAAALTILRGYLISDERAPGKLASFEDWDGLVRNAVVWLAGKQDYIDLVDPVFTIDDADDADTAKGALHGFFEMWHQRFGEEAIPASTVVNYANTYTGTAADDFRPEAEEEENNRKAFRNALVSAVRADSRKTGEVGPVEFGQWIGGQKGVVLGNFRVESEYDRKRKLALWKVVRP